MLCTGHCAEHHEREEYVDEGGYVDAQADMKHQAIVAPSLWMDSVCANMLRLKSTSSPPTVGAVVQAVRYMVGRG